MSSRALHNLYKLPVAGLQQNRPLKARCEPAATQEPAGVGQAPPIRNRRARSRMRIRFAATWLGEQANGQRRLVRADRAPPRQHVKTGAGCTYAGRSGPL